MQDVLGAAAVASMAVFYALEPRGPIFTLAFALGCFASAAYAFWIAAWPFFVVETLWGGIAVGRWSSRRKKARQSMASV